MNISNKLFSALAIAAISLLPSGSLLADDTEVYLEQINLPPEQTRPNVLFILDTSGSMHSPINFAAYNPATVYPGNDNFSGGGGDSDYYYIYDFSRRYYFNRVHSNQMLCDMSMLTGTTPWTANIDRYIFNTGAAWGGAPGGSNNDDSRSDPMCAESDPSCAFTGSPTGPLVDCGLEENRVTQNNRYTTGGTQVFVTNANHHNYLQARFRFTTLQTVMRDLIDADYDINMSMMRFNGGNGGYVIQESILANDANDATNANQRSMRQTVDQLTFGGVTPLSETLWEAYRYMAGLSADYGNDGGTNTPSAAYSSGTTYNSPIDYACQKSHIIVLTDGTPVSDTGRDGQIEGASYTGSNCTGNCLDEFAGWVHNDGAFVRDHSGLVGDQEISVHTIGFGGGADPTLMQNAANNGGGLYRPAANASELGAAFEAILDQVDFERDTFVAPAVAVNAYNGLQHRNELYFALFQPQAAPRWKGNIKKYKLLNGKIVDSNDVDAINDGDGEVLNTGYFKDDALSYWTTPTDWDGNGSREDGADIEFGGFAYELDDPDNRNVYTYIGSPTPSSVVLNTEPLADANTNITTDLLGLGTSDATTEAERTNILNWALGYDIESANPVNSNPANNVPNYYVSDLIHNQPVVVTYHTDSADPDNPIFDDTLYAASNMGLFHAIDPDDGSEEFAFIPQELLPNLTAYYANVGGFSAKIYGLDSPMTIWRNDNDGDGNIVTSAGGTTPDTDAGGNADHVYVYQGMRRGGNNLYALDVTNRNNPRLLWQILGGAGGTTGFERMGQSWSVPQLGKIQYGTTDLDVLIFGGGYDTVHDTTTTPTSGDQGNAIYIVNARTGALIWSVDSSSGGNFSGMDNSIPANVTIADVDGDAYTDFVFAIDIQGTMWRIDLPSNATSQADFVANIQGGAIAELGGTGNDFRRFYNAPDVAYFDARGESSFLTASVTSGYRSDPREVILNDYLFVLFDPHARTVPSSYDYAGSGPVQASDLTTTSFASPATASQHGWKLALGDPGDGEKGLSRTITFNDQIIMTSYIPSLTTCEGGSGSGKFYLLDALNGRSRLVDALDNPVEYTDLLHGGIPPEPAVIFGTKEVCVENCADADDTNDVTEEQSDLVVCVGTECINDQIDLSLHKTYWREN